MGFSRTYAAAATQPVFDHPSFALQLEPLLTVLFLPFQVCNRGCKGGGSGVLERLFGDDDQQHHEAGEMALKTHAGQLRTCYIEARVQVPYCDLTICS
jgi:hypothetical protein